MSDTLRPDMDWTSCRRVDGSIDLDAAFLVRNPPYWRKSREFLALVSGLQPIRSRQAAAIALALAESGVFEKDE